MGLNDLDTELGNGALEQENETLVRRKKIHTINWFRTGLGKGPG